MNNVNINTQFHVLINRSMLITVEILFYQKYYVCFNTSHYNTDMRGRQFKTIQIQYELNIQFIRINTFFKCINNSRITNRYYEPAAILKKTGILHWRIILLSV